MSTEPTLPEIPALDIIEHLNELLARFIAENRALMRLLARREREIALLGGVDRAKKRRGDR